MQRWHAEFDRFQTSWYTETMPNIAAGMRLAIEVLETFGPGFTKIDDDTEASPLEQQIPCVGKGIQPGSNLIPLVDHSNNA